MAYTMTHLPHDAMTDSQDHPPTDSTSSHMTSVELDAHLQPRHSSRKRLVQAGSITLAVLLVIGFLVYPHWASGFGHDGATPPSTSTPDVPIVLLSNVTYGSLTVNGKQLNSPPPAIAYLHPGRNTIDLKTPPFLPQHCVITWPEQQVTGSNCVIKYDTQTFTIRGRSVVPVFVIDMLLTAAQLPQDARDAALQLVGQALTDFSATSSLPVPAGQYFAVGNLPDGKLHVNQLTETIQAKVVTDAPVERSPVGGPDCSNLGCANSLDPEGATLLTQQFSTSNVWVIGSVVSLRLDFTTTQGTSRGSLMLSKYDPLTLFLSYTPNGGWRVLNGKPVNQQFIITLSDQTDEYVCGAGSGWLHQLAQQTVPATALPSFDDMNTLNTRGLRGCEFQVNVPKSSGTQSAQFLWRFGALLSENATAHQLLPGIPMAPHDEIAAVTS